MLTSVIIPNNITNIGSLIFYGCSSLSSISIPNSVTSIDGLAFYGCSSLTSINIPNSVTSIGGSAFYGCTGLCSIIIGESIETIGETAFSNCPDLTDVYCYAKTVPNMKTYYGIPTTDAFEGSYIEYATLHVPVESVNSYRTTEPWSSFGTIVALDGETPDVEKCATPSIIYANGTLSFRCDTEGVQFVSDIIDSDIKRNYDADVPLSATYHISVYATKNGYDDSDVATGTLCWIDQQPDAEGIVAEDAVHEIKALPVLIQSHGGIISVQGLDAGTEVFVYTTDGKQQGSAVVVNGATTIHTSLQPGSIAVVKIGERNIKVLMK